MKELSVEEKAQRYDEAIKIAKELQHDNCWVTSIFPELKENEGKRIKNFISNELACLRATYEKGTVRYSELTKAIAWLEEQGTSYTKRDVDDAYLKGVTNTKNEIEKQYEANYQIRKDIATFIFNYRGDIKDRAKWMNYLGIKVSLVEKQGEQKPTDKVEPKFKVGDWITNGIDCTFQIASMENGIYYDTNNCGSDIESTDKSYHLWTIQDAKDGDVLTCDDKVTDCPFIFHNLTKELNPRSYCGLNTLGHFQDNDENGGYWCHFDEVRPAPKEQRDLLFQKIKEAGYEWNANKKKLEKIVVPIFNVGDTIIKKHNSDINKFGQFTITDITGGKYWYNDRIICDIIEQDEWELYEPVRQKTMCKTK